MMCLLEHRGPDSNGLHCFANENYVVAFGHQRLAIIDLSPAGHQPMLTPDGTIGVVFNGCIYNFEALRRDLQKLGYTFQSNCDTEVLLAGYKHWGIDGLSMRLRGMFAFAIWDQNRRSLFLVRDRLGVKPLVYATKGDTLAFASSIPALRASGVTGELNSKGVLEFLEFGWIGEKQTIYEDARKVQPATIVEWRAGKISERSYWTLGVPHEKGPTFEEAIEQAEHLILEAVRLRLVADVPVAALLSAGTDSTLVCWALTKLGANLQTFTVGTPGDPADEAADAAYTARKLNLPHEIIGLGQEEPGLDDLIRAYPEPFACSSALGMLRVCSAVKQKAKVLLTGDGGDDIFLGYSHYLNFLRAERLANRLPRMFARAWSTAGWRPSRPYPLKRAVSLLNYATGGLGAVTANHDGLPFYLRRDMLGERLAGLQLAARTIPLSFDSAQQLLGDYHSYELQTRFVSEYMTKVDSASMFYAIESRAPFFDHELWAFAGSLPRELRMQRGELKAILRAIVRRHLGSEVADRPKRGFTIPVERWLVTNWRSQLTALGQDSLLERDGWMRKGSIRPAVDEAITQGRAPVQLWYLVVLEKWLERYVGG